jgi:hypothetical protein
VGAEEASFVDGAEALVKYHSCVDLCLIVGRLAGNETGPGG